MTAKARKKTTFDPATLRYKAPIFLSYPRPINAAQAQFIGIVAAYLDSRDLSPRTLGVSGYSMDAPLTAIRRLMVESHGLLTIAFRRTHVTSGTINKGTDIAGMTEHPVLDQWQTSPWAHIEPAMAFQLGLPILVLRETGVAADGVLQHGVVGLYMPEFDLSHPDGPEAYLLTAEWQDLIRQWEARVMRVAETKGLPPRLYG